MYTSPDARIQQMLSDYPTTLETALQAFIVREKYIVGSKIMPGLWSGFLKSAEGASWLGVWEGLCKGEETTTPPPVPKSLPAPTSDPVPSQGPLQEDLFGLLAKGLQQRGLQAEVSDERVRQVVQAEIERYLNEGTFNQTHLLYVQEGSAVPTKVYEGTLPPPAWFARGYKLALCRVNCLLVGPRGCGKTTTGALLATALGLPFYPISLNAGVDEGVIQGWVRPSQKGLYFEYQRAQFGKAYEEGGVVLLDEWDAADPNTAIITHAALSNGHWGIPLMGEDAPPLTRHADFVVLAAANTHGYGADRVYVGRNQLDGATLDRFAIGTIEVDYDETMERQAYDVRSVDYGQRLRARCRAQSGWTRDVSTRNIADAHRLLERMPVEEAWYGFYASWTEHDLARVGAVRDRGKQTVNLE